MSAFTVNTFFSAGGNDSFDDAELLADPGLLARLRLADGAAGGLCFTNDNDQLYIDDDFDTLTAQVLQALPRSLREGSGRTIRLHAQGDRFEVSLAGDTVTFDFGYGKIMKEPLPEVLAALDAAADRLTRVLQAGTAPRS